MKNNSSSILWQEKDSVAYKNYLETRDAVLAMMENAPRGDFAEPSEYWKEELAGFAYLLDASPLLIKNLRHHGYHFTGVHEWEYRKHHAYHTKRFSESLQELRSRDERGLLVPEPRELGGFGYEIDGALYNADTLRFYSALIWLDRLGGLDVSRGAQDKKIVVEIGSGFGGFAYQFKTLFPNTTYVLVDFPSSILFAGTYLKTLFPRARVLFVTGNGNIPRDVAEYDFVFVPHYAWTSLRFKLPDLLINIASFQEMKTKQMEEYIRYAREWGIPQIFSVNHERNYSNPEMDMVSGVLGKYYALHEAYIRTPRSIVPIVRNIYNELKNIVKILIGRKTKASKKHLLGKLI